MARMKITDGKGVHFELANGITISIQIGRGNYSDNYDFPDFTITRENPLPWAERAEIAVWGMDGNWFDLDGDQVAGYVPVEKVVTFISYLNDLPHGASAKTIALDCSILKQEE